jgi:hypothetical protein
MFLTSRHGCAPGHGFKKKVNIDFYLEREAMFVEQYLLRK